MNINVGTWAIASSTPVDGTVNGMAYDTASGALVQTLLQNGSATALSSGTTYGNAVLYSAAAQTSYTTQNLFSVAAGSATTASFIGDNSAYVRSSIASYLAFPAQTAFTPPIYTSSSGDITATVSGTILTVSIVSTGKILIQGNLPYPARGVALNSAIVYLTMPDSNSLVSLPVVIP